jgi:hypothetical protein
LPNPRLTPEQLTRANELLSKIRADLVALSKADPLLLFAYRRKIAKELTYDERGSPMHRRALKRRKWVEQGGTCPLCLKDLPQTYTVLDRYEAVPGYIDSNVRLVHQDCDRQTQTERGYR